PARPRRLRRGCGGDGGAPGLSGKRPGGGNTRTRASLAKGGDPPDREQPMRSSSRAFAAGLVSLASSLISLPVLALGLGSITLHSALNETLDASIEVLDLDGLDASQLDVGLASPGEFSRADLDFPDFLRDIEITLEVLSPERGVLRLRSRALVV